MTPLPAYKTAIHPDAKAAALASYASSTENQQYFGSFFGFLVDRDRPDDARLFVDDPGQLNATSLERMIQKLSQDRADAWSLPLFEAVMKRAPTLPPSNAEGAIGPLSLSFVGFGERLDRAERVIERLIAAYGVDLPLRYGHTLLGVVAATGSAALVTRVIAAGGRPEQRDAWDRLPIEALLSATELGFAEAAAIRALAVGPLPKSPALAAFLHFAATSGAIQPETGLRGPRPIDEILDVARALIELGASATRSDSGEASPLGAALRLPHPKAERMQVVDLLLSTGRAGATLIEALPDVVQGYTPSAVADALDRAGYAPGLTFAKDASTLLHAAVRNNSNFFVHRSEPGFMDERFIPTIELLIARGEELAATNAKGKTAFDLARKEKDWFGEHWNRIAALLKREAPIAPAGLSRLGEPGFALGVAAALLAAKKLPRKSVEKAFRGAEGDDENEREAAAVDALLELPVPDAALASVRALSFGFESEIYTMLSEATDADAGGESEVLAFSSIDGVRALPQLEELDLTDYGLGVTSLAPLAGHPTLKTLHLYGGGPAFDGADALLSMRKLAKIYVYPHGAERLGAVATALAAKGITVENAMKEPPKRAASAKRKPAANKSVKKRR